MSVASVASVARGEYVRVAVIAVTDVTVAGGGAIAVIAVMAGGRGRAGTMRRRVAARQWGGGDAYMLIVCGEIVAVASAASG